MTRRRLTGIAEVEFFWTRPSGQQVLVQGCGKVIPCEWEPAHVENQHVVVLGDEGEEIELTAQELEKVESVVTTRLVENWEECA